ncbi:MAG TPA: hypothetical protein VN366_01305 [Feifaniaceae bacterium]|nr:hypothetical protein [Feifaniaceae bacterium]
MAGILLCFVLPGILIGLLLGESVQAAKKKARLLEKKRARENRRQLYIHDMRSDACCVLPNKRAA